MDTPAGIDPKEAWKNNSEIFVLYRYEESLVAKQKAHNIPRYQPSLVLACVAFVLFFISTLIHIIQAWRYRSYYFIPLIIGGVCK